MNNNRKLKVLTILVSAAISNLSGISVVSASVVNNLLPYQIYRDFAENKGDFILRRKVLSCIITQDY